jgi:RNA polymerase sigma factor (sigma-70 family)
MARPETDCSGPAGESGADTLPWWQAWREQRDMAAREALIRHYLSHARMIAASYYRHRTHDEIGFDDYFQLSSLALVESVDRFDPAVGARFTTYCARRMHGAILDGLEKLTEKNRQIALQRRLREALLAESAAEHPQPTGGNDARESTGTRLKNPGRGASSKTKTGSSNPLDQETLFRMLAQSGIGIALGFMLEGTGMFSGATFPEGGSGPGSASDLAFRPASGSGYDLEPDSRRGGWHREDRALEYRDDHGGGAGDAGNAADALAGGSAGPGPAPCLLFIDESGRSRHHYPDPMAQETGASRAPEFQRLQRVLQRAIEQLNRQEQIVVRAHYLEDRTFAEIAASLGVKRARISQLHRQALQKLQLALAGGTAKR